MNKWYFEYHKTAKIVAPNPVAQYEGFWDDRNLQQRLMSDKAGQK